MTEEIPNAIKQTAFQCPTCGVCFTSEEFYKQHYFDKHLPDDIKSESLIGNFYLAAANSSVCGGAFVVRYNQDKRKFYVLRVDKSMFYDDLCAPELLSYYDTDHPFPVDEARSAMAAEWDCLEEQYNNERKASLKQLDKWLREYKANTEAKQ